MLLYCMRRIEHPRQQRRCHTNSLCIKPNRHSVCRCPTSNKNPCQCPTTNLHPFHCSTTNNRDYQDRLAVQTGYNAFKNTTHLWRYLVLVIFLIATMIVTSTFLPNRQCTSRHPCLCPTSTKHPCLCPTSTKHPRQCPTTTKHPSQCPTSTKHPSQCPAITRDPRKCPTTTREQCTSNLPNIQCK